MSSLLDDITAYVAAYPQATVSDIRAEFGDPVLDNCRLGIYKTYCDMVFQRGGVFVHVQHRDFGTTQAIRVREVEPMEVTRVQVTYVAAHPSSGEGPMHWHHQTKILPNAEAVLSALAR